MNAVELTDTCLYQGLVQRFVEGRDWLDTDLHPNRYRVTFDNAPRKYSSFTLDEFSSHGAYLDELHESMRVNGYLHHRQTGQPFESEMSVCLRRDGHLARNSGGLHRLILAQLLDLPKIYVRLLAVHPDAGPPMMSA